LGQKRGATDDMHFSMSPFFAVMSPFLSKIRGFRTEFQKIEILADS